MVGLDDIVEVLHLPVARVFALLDDLVGRAMSDDEPIATKITVLVAAVLKA